MHPVARTSQPCFRGVALAGLLRAARQYDADSVEGALAHHASDALRTTLQSLDPRSWYPAQAHLELLDLLLVHVAGEDRTILADLARQAMAGDLRGIYRVLLRVMSPTWVVAHSERFLGAYLNYGMVEILDRTIVSARVRFTLDPSNEAFWAALPGAIRGTVEASGAEHVRVLLAEHERPDSAVYRLSWD